MPTNRCKRNDRLTKAPFGHQHLYVCRDREMRMRKEGVIK